MLPGVGQLSASSYISKLKEENITESKSAESINKAIEEQLAKQIDL